MSLAEHRRRAALLLLAGLTGAVGLTGAAGCAGTRAGSQASSDLPVQLEPRQIIVAVPLVTPALRADMARQLAVHHDIRLVGAFPLPSIDVHCIVYEVPADRDVEGLIRELASQPGVELVQGNQRFEGLGSVHSDPYASFQHGAETLRADAAHRWATGRGVRVGVVDTGVDTEHPDLAGRVAETGNFVEGGEDSFARDEHGTAVAGVIAARADDGQGIYGIAPDAELVVAKACWHGDTAGSPALCSSWTLARAIDFAVGSGVRVLNLSLAGPEDGLLTRLLAAAHERGVVITAAAGDDTRRPAFPASLGFVIAVVASDERGAVPSRDWSGETFVLAAPGAEIITTAPGARYRFLSGSSLSTAHVSGAAALLLERAPGLSSGEVGALLAATAHTPGESGAADAIGRIDACAAIHRLSGGDVCR